MSKIKKILEVMGEYLAMQVPGDSNMTEPMKFQLMQQQMIAAKDPEEPACDKDSLGDFLDKVVPAALQPPEGLPISISRTSQTRRSRNSAITFDACVRPSAAEFSIADIQALSKNSVLIDPLYASAITNARYDVTSARNFSSSKYPIAKLHWCVRQAYDALYSLATRIAGRG